jgi:hypothetical protein
MKEYGNQLSFLGPLVPEQVMVALAERELEFDFIANKAKFGWAAEFPGVQKPLGPPPPAREPCPNDIADHADCPLCDGSCQGDIIPGKFVHRFGWYLIVED